MFLFSWFVRQMMIKIPTAVRMEREIDSNSMLIDEMIDDTRTNELREQSEPLHQGRLSSRQPQHTFHPYPNPQRFDGRPKRRRACHI